MSFVKLTEACYRLVVLDRVTGDLVCDLTNADITGVFNRQLDGVSGMEITLKQGACDGCLCPVIERRHELAIFREDWPAPAWIGPIVRTVDDPASGSLRYVADDRAYWWSGAPALQAYASGNKGPVEIFEDLIRMAEGYQPTQLDRVFTGSQGPLPPDNSGVDLDVDVKEGASVYEKMSGLAKSLVDWSVVGDQVYWGSPEIPLTQGALLTLPMWKDAPPIIDRDATSTASRVSVTGSGGVVAIWPPVEEDNEIYGKRTLFVADTNLDDFDEALALAKALYEQNRSASDFLVTGTGSLSTRFPHPLHWLIPGRLFEVEISGLCLSTSEVLRLSNVVVEFESRVVKGEKKLAELRVAIDLQREGTVGTAERASG